MYSNVKLIEEILNRKLNRDVQVKKHSLYADGDLTTKGRIYIDGYECDVEIDFYDLTEYNKRGILTQYLNKISNKIKETL